MSTDDRPTPPASSESSGEPQTAAAVAAAPPASPAPGLLDAFDEPGKYRRWLALVVLLAVLFQALLVSSSPPVARDGVTFLTLARKLQEHPIDAMRGADQHPGFPALVIFGRLIVTAVVALFDVLGWLISHLFGRHGTFFAYTADFWGSVFSWIWGARLVSGVFGILSVLAVWRLAVRTFDRRTAIFAAALVAILPVFRQNAADALSDSLHLFLYVAAASLAIEAIMRRQLRWFVMTGAASGLAYWVRPEGISPAIVTAIFLPVWAWRTRKLRMRSVLEFAFVMILAAVLVMAPYFLMAGKFSSKMAEKENPADDPAPRAVAPAEITVAPDASAKGAASPAAARDIAAEPAVAKPMFPAVIAATKRLLSASAESLCWALLAPLIAGFFVRDDRPDRSGVHLLVLMLVTFHAALLIWLFSTKGYIDKRHVMPMLALAMPRIAAGFVALAEAASKTRAAIYLVRVAHESAAWVGSAIHRPPDELDARARVGWVGAGFVLLFSIIAVPQTLEPLHPANRDIVNASFELQQWSKPGDLVLTNSPYVPFYSQLKGVMLLKEDSLKPGFNFIDACRSCRFVVFEAEDDPYRTIWPDLLKANYSRIDFLTVSAPSKVRQKHVLGFKLLPATPVAPPPKE